MTGNPNGSDNLCEGTFVAKCKVYKAHNSKILMNARLVSQLGIVSAWAGINVCIEFACRPRRSLFMHHVDQPFQTGTPARARKMWKQNCQSTFKMSMNKKASLTI